MTEPVLPGRPGPDDTSGLRDGDYVRGLVTVVVVLVLGVIAIWVTLTILGFDPCGCTRGPAAPVP